MKILAIGDRFIDGAAMAAGLAELSRAGHAVVVREWTHPDLEALQRDNLAVEERGPDAVGVPAALYEDIAAYDALIVQFAPVSEGVIRRAAKLKLIGVLRGGVENVALDAARGRGVAVANTPGRNARAVAEFTLGMILAEVRNIARAHAALKTGEWRKEFPNSGRVPELYGKTVGLIGIGNVGHLVAGYLRAFGCAVIAYDPYVEAADGIELCGLRAVMERADIVSVHARYTVDTHHLIGASELAWMKPEAVLINTARAGLVDQAALVNALRARRIAGAALDVFDEEPLGSDDDILRLDNLTITTHLAGSTADAFVGSPRLFSRMLLEYLRANKGLSIINAVRY